MFRWLRLQGIVWGILLGSLVFLGLGVYGDLTHVSGTLSHFSASYVPALLLLALVNYFLRYLRWEFYLRWLDIRPPPSQSLPVFFSGLAFSVTPGKVGELAKSYLLKRVADVPISRSTPVVVMERVSDLSGVLLLALWGGMSLGYGWQVLGLSGGLLIGGIFLLTSPRLLSWLQRILPARMEPLLLSQGLLRSLLSPPLFSASLSLSVLAWFAECYGFWLVMDGLHAPLPLLSATFVYTLATLVGALSFLPGGLITTEGSMVAALAFLQISPAVSSTATLLIRLCTLWFAVALGMAGLWVCGHQSRRVRNFTTEPQRGEI